MSYIGWQLFFILMVKYLRKLLTKVIRSQYHKGLHVLHLSLTFVADKQNLIDKIDSKLKS